MKAGHVVDLSYKLHWLNDEPKMVREQTELARTVATRIGMGGEPGALRPQGLKKFVVEFYGAPLANVPPTEPTARTRTWSITRPCLTA